jgi:hypothetical protein
LKDKYEIKSESFKRRGTSLIIKPSSITSFK